MIDTLMIFAAGFGKRMLPLTQTTPKPLLEIGGKPMLYHALDLAQNAGFKTIIINSHYLSSLIQEAIDQYVVRFRPQAKIHHIYEPNILETGGAVKNAHYLFADKDVIFTMNSDSIITFEQDIWSQMFTSWDKAYMDFMLLLSPLARSFGSIGNGDFDLEPNGQIHRNNQVKRYMFTGLQIVKVDLIMHNPLHQFSLAHYYTPGQYRLHGFVNPGIFYHISNPQDYSLYNAKLSV